MADERYIVDSGVFARWYVPQVGFEHAREVRADFLAGTVELVTTDAARYELGHVLRTHGLLKGHLDRDQYVKAAQTIDVLDLARPVDAEALRSAAELAAERMLRFFDALFVAFTLRHGGILLTSDGGLANAAGGLVPIELLRGIGHADRG